MKLLVLFALIGIAVAQFPNYSTYRPFGSTTQAYRYNPFGTTTPAPRYQPYRPFPTLAPSTSGNDGKYRGGNDGKYRPADDGKYRGGSDGKYSGGASGQYNRGKEGDYTGSNIAYRGNSDKQVGGGQYQGGASTGGQYQGGAGAGGQYQGGTGGQYRGDNSGKYTGSSNAYQHQAGPQGSGSPYTGSSGSGARVVPVQSTTFRPTGVNTYIQPVGPTGLPYARKYAYNTEGGWRIFRDNKHVDEDGYAYEYETENKIVAAEQGRIHNRGTDLEGMKASGFYEYVGDDGVTYRVDYVADENGYRPVGAHIPTIPPAIQRSLDYIAAKNRQ